MFVVDKINSSKEVEKRYKNGGDLLVKIINEIMILIMYWDFMMGINLLKNVF